MGVLKEKIDEMIETKGGIFEAFKDNSLNLFEKLNKSDSDVYKIEPYKMSLGGFYFLHYKDDSNWMRYSPVFVIDFKKVSNLIIVYAVNLNFIPLEIRTDIFDNYILEKDMINDNDLPVNYEGMYKELLKYAFEYSIVEYNFNQIVSIDRIDMNYLPNFLYSQHPINKYEPKNLYNIWNKKLETRKERHEELYKSLVTDFTNVSNDITGNFNHLRNHIKRLQNSIKKYG